MNVVRIPRDEITWERAMVRAREEYPEATGDHFDRIVMTIYKKMSHYRARSSPMTEKAAAARRMR